MKLFIILLAVLFIALKLLNIVAWSWWLVLAPVWVSALIAISIIVFWLYLLIKMESKKNG